MTRPFDIALIDTDDRTSPDIRAVGAYLADTGMAVRWVATKQLTRSQVNVTRQTLAIGGLPFIAAALRQLHIDLPEPNDYPDVLCDHLHRDTWESTIEQLRHRLDTGQPTFAKPRHDRKRFPGRVYDHPDTWPLTSLAAHLPIWCSEPVEWLTEWRVFVAKSTVVGTRNYDGNPDLTPDQRTVDNCVQQLGNTLAGYALDIGVLHSGHTAVVELNEGFAIGTYGLPAASTTKVFTARWHQLLATSRPQDSPTNRR